MGQTREWDNPGLLFLIAATILFISLATVMMYYGFPTIASPVLLNGEKVNFNLSGGNNWTESEVVHISNEQNVSLTYRKIDSPSISEAGIDLNVTLTPDRAPKNITITAAGSNLSDTHQKRIPVEINFYEGFSNFIGIIDANIMATPIDRAGPNHTNGTTGIDGSPTDGNTASTDVGTQGYIMNNITFSNGENTNLTSFKITNQQLQNQSIIILPGADSLINHPQYQDTEDTSLQSNQSNEVRGLLGKKKTADVINQTFTGNINSSIITVNGNNITLLVFPKDEQARSSLNNGTVSTTPVVGDYNNSSFAATLDIDEVLTKLIDTFDPSQGGETANRFLDVFGRVLELFNGTIQLNPPPPPPPPPSTIPPVPEPNQRPIARDLDIWTYLDTPVHIRLTGYDFEGNPLKFMIDVPPSYGILSNDAVSSGNSFATYTYTPNDGFRGNDSFLFRSFDDKNYSDQARVDININDSTSQNNKPIATDDVFIFASSNDSQILDPLSNDIDIDNDKLSIDSISAQKDSATINQSDYTIIYRPANSSVFAIDRFNYTILDSENNSDTGTVTVIIQPRNKPPIADAGENQTVNPSEIVLLNGTDSQDPDLDGNITQYLWQELGGNVTFSLDNINTSMASFVAPNVSSDIILNFSLKVTDNREATSTPDIASVIVKGFNHSPIANAGPDLQVEAEQSVILNGNRSKDADGDYLTYTWTQIPGDANIVLKNANTSQPLFTAPVVPNKTSLEFILTVSDEGGKSNTDNVYVNVSSPNENRNKLIITKKIDPFTINLIGSERDPEKANIELKVKGFGQRVMKQVLVPKDMVFAIDSSSSMEQKDPDDSRLNLTNQLIEKLDSSRDQAGLVSWDVNNDSSISLNSEFEALRAEVDNIDSAGPTNIATGLQYAMDILDANKRNESSTKAIIFMSDGKGEFANSNFNKNSIIGIAKSKGYKIFTVGLNPDRIGSTMLYKIAKNTGGEYLPSLPTENINRLFDNLSQFQTIVESRTEPKNIDVIEATQKYIENESNFSIPPSKVNEKNGHTVMIWENVSQHVGNRDSHLGANETFAVSFEAQSSKAEDIVPVQDRERSLVRYLNAEGEEGAIHIPPVYVNVKP
jgi:von Willebrand factor type A domain/Bacterial Ig domain/PKD domain